MNFKDIIGPDELDWKVIPLDWKKIGKDELKLGTPMSKDGLEANDASCYGILMDDVEKSKHFQARVIVSGCVDFAKAEEYSGIKISEEAKNAIGKVWSQAGGGTGPIDPKRLPEGYPYKEQSEVVVLAEETVTPTQIGTSASYMGNLSVAPALEAGKEYVVHLNGVKYVSTAFETSPAEGVTIIMLTDTGTQPPNKWGVQVMGEQAGVMTTSPEPYTFSITEQSETIHPMAEEFLPAGVGGPCVLYAYRSSGDKKVYLEAFFENPVTKAQLFEIAKRSTIAIYDVSYNYLFTVSLCNFSGEPAELHALMVDNDGNVTGFMYYTAEYVGGGGES